MKNQNKNLLIERFFFSSLCLIRKAFRGEFNIRLKKELRKDRNEQEDGTSVA